MLPGSNYIFYCCSKMVMIKL